MRKEPPDKRESKTPPSQEICTKCGKSLVPASKPRKIYRNRFGMRYSRQKLPKRWRAMKCGCPPERFNLDVWRKSMTRQPDPPPISASLNYHDDKDVAKAKKKFKAKRHRQNQNKGKR